MLHVKSSNDCRLLQNDIYSLVDPSNGWELNCHPSKCQNNLLIKHVLFKMYLRKYVTWHYKMGGK